MILHLQQILIVPSADPPSTNDRLCELLDDTRCLKERILSGTAQEVAAFDVAETTDERMASICNMLNYVVMRREDLRPLQERLAAAGLSSLGRGEPHVLTNIDRVIEILSRAVQQSTEEAGNAGFPAEAAGPGLLRQRTERMFGAARVERSEYIIVTMPTEAAGNVGMVEQLLAAGMDSARINCAHDDEPVWHSMIDNLGNAARQSGKKCTVLMELGGHKIRTGKVVCASRSSGKTRKKKSPGRVHLHDWLILCKNCGAPELYSRLFEVPVRAVVPCTYPAIVDQLQTGQTVWIDDGKIGAVIRDRRGDAALLQVNRVGPRGARIREEKGLNFPETQLNLPTLSDKDRQDLKFVSQHADLVGLSFTEGPEDVLSLRDELH